MTRVDRRTLFKLGAGIGAMACLAPIASSSLSIGDAGAEGTPIRLRLGAGWPLYGNLLGLSTRRLAQRIQWLTGGAVAVELVDIGTGSLPALADIGDIPVDAWHAAAHLWPGAPPVWSLFGMQTFGMTAPEIRVWRATAPGLDQRERMAARAGLKVWFTGEVAAGGMAIRGKGWPGSGRIACSPGSSALWERLGFDTITRTPAAGLGAVVNGEAVAAEVPPLLAGPVRRLGEAGLGYVRFGTFAPGMATELLVKSPVIATLPADLQAKVAQACAEEAAALSAEAAQDEQRWLTDAAEANLLIDMPADSMVRAGRTAGDLLRSLESDAYAHDTVDAYRKVRRHLGATAAGCCVNHTAFG
jgi:TRAP-type mannitol/chloroaromatic compound transport system substrate-binding protein